MNNMKCKGRTRVATNSIPVDNSEQKGRRFLKEKRSEFKPLMLVLGFFVVVLTTGSVEAEKRCSEDSLLWGKAGGFYEGMPHYLGKIYKGPKDNMILSEIRVPSFHNYIVRDIRFVKPGYSTEQCHINPDATVLVSAGGTLGPKEFERLWGTPKPTPELVVSFCVNFANPPSDPKILPDSFTLNYTVEFDCPACKKTKWCYDGDGDGHGDPSKSKMACEAPTKHVSNCDDYCDIHPKRTSPREWCYDGDGDGHGDPSESEMACEAPTRHVSNCDDECDKNPDRTKPSNYYYDADKDGYGDPEKRISRCNYPAGNYVTKGQDCNDGDASINPKTRWYVDMDRDGFGDYQKFSERRYLESCVDPSNSATRHARNAKDIDDMDPKVDVGIVEINSLHYDLGLDSPGVNFANNEWIIFSYVSTSSEDNSRLEISKMSSNVVFDFTTRQNQTVTTFAPHGEESCKETRGEHSSKYVCVFYIEEVGNYRLRGGIQENENYSTVAAHDIVISEQTDMPILPQEGFSIGSLGTVDIDFSFVGYDQNRDFSQVELVKYEEKESCWYDFQRFQRACHKIDYAVSTDIVICEKTVGEETDDYDCELVVAESGKYRITIAKGTEQALSQVFEVADKIFHPVSIPSYSDLVPPKRNNGGI